MVLRGCHLGLRWGIDLDGVLAQFNPAFRQLLVEQTGRDLWTYHADPPIWDWPEALGYFAEELDAAWEAVCLTPFWVDKVEAYPGVDTFLHQLDSHPDDVLYFITSRVGPRAKHYTECWLRQVGVRNPTVLMAEAADKPLLVEGLRLGVFVDDHLLTCLRTAQACPRCHVYVLNHGWNQGEAEGVARVDSLLEILEREGI